MNASAPVVKKDAAAVDLWTRYRIRLRVDRLVAGLPASEKTMTAWLDKHGVTGADRQEQLAQLTREGIAEAHSVVFYRDDEGTPCLEGRCVKALFKEAANILKDVFGVKAFRSKIAERVFVEEHHIPLEGTVLTGERPVSVMTMQGPRTSLKSYEYMDGVQISCTLRVLNDGVVDEAQLRKMLEYAQSNGLGADRSQGAGTFTLVELRRLQSA